MYRKFLTVCSTKANRNIWKPIGYGGNINSITKDKLDCQLPLFVKHLKITAILGITHPLTLIG